MRKLFNISQNSNKPLKRLHRCYIYSGSELHQSSWCTHSSNRILGHWDTSYVEHPTDRYAKTKSFKIVLPYYQDSFLSGIVVVVVHSRLIAAVNLPGVMWRLIAVYPAHEKLGLLVVQIPISVICYQKRATQSRVYQSERLVLPSAYVHFLVASSWWCSYSTSNSMDPCSFPWVERCSHG